MLLKMSYEHFLVLIKENTNTQFGYKSLCRFCLHNESHGVDLIEGNDDFIARQRRNSLFDSYQTITKKYLPISPDYPNIVCAACEFNLSQNATFISQIEQNAENWEIFLKRDDDPNAQTNSNIIGIEEIKIEKCEDDSFVNVPEANIYDIFDPFGSNDEKPMVDIQTESPTPCYQDILKDNAINVSSRKRKKVDKSTVKHLNLTTEYERTCKLCNEPTFSSMKHYYKHHSQQHPGRKCFTCDMCGVQFIKKEVLYSHMQDRHSQSGRKFQCQFCAKQFFTDREVKEHEKSHLNTRSYVCKLCGKGFNRKSELNTHLKSKDHNPEYKTKKQQKVYPSRQKYRCELCIPQELFQSAEEKANHTNSVHKTYECNTCKNTFLTQESLDSHKLRHSNKPRNFVCTVCSATFCQSSHLATHYKCKHTNDRSFQCSHCDKRFFEVYSLTVHVNLVHTKQERVKCPQCPTTFASDKYLKGHIRQKHSTGIPHYVCKSCGKRCENGARLDLHRLKYH